MQDIRIKYILRRFLVKRVFEDTLYLFFINNFSKLATMRYIKYETIIRIIIPEKTKLRLKTSDP